MPNTNPDILVQRFVDGDLSPDEVQTALHRIADDQEARELLQFELEMTQDLAASQSTSPPDTFADDTMAALEPDASRPPALSDRLRAWWQAITTPVTLDVRPLPTAVAALLVGMVAWILWPMTAPGPRPGPPSASTPQPTKTSPSVQTTSAASSPQGTVWIRFMYTNNAADSVAVAGDFSQWTPVPLSPRTVNGETVWTGLVPVSQGEHEYQFVINGDRWVPDPLAPVKRGDGFGTKNAVLKI
jgi:hypothetical protein